MEVDPNLRTLCTYKLRYGCALFRPFSAVAAALASSSALPCGRPLVCVGWGGAVQCWMLQIPVLSTPESTELWLFPKSKKGPPDTARWREPRKGTGCDLPQRTACCQGGVRKKMGCCCQGTCWHFPNVKNNCFSEPFTGHGQSAAEELIRSTPASSPSTKHSRLQRETLSPKCQPRKSELDKQGGLVGQFVWKTLYKLDQRMGLTQNAHPAHARP